MVMLIVELVQALPWNLRGVIDINDPFKSCVTATYRTSTSSRPQHPKIKRSKNENTKTAVKASKIHEIHRIS